MHHLTQRSSKPISFGKVQIGATLIGLVLCSTSVFAQNAASVADTKAANSTSDAGKWTIYGSPYTLHFSDAVKEKDNEPDDIKHSYVWAVGAEKMLDERYLAGASFFSNSFGQPSQYVYVGAKFRPIDTHPKLFTKITGGILHGYKEPYDKKIPINTKNGWGIGATLSAGWDFNKNFGAQLNMLGTAGLMLQLNYTLD